VAGREGAAVDPDHEDGHGLPVQPGQLVFLLLVVLVVLPADDPSHVLVVAVGRAERPLAVDGRSAELAVVPPPLHGAQQREVLFEDLEPVAHFACSFRKA
jgi:hypothetical protein